MLKRPITDQAESALNDIWGLVPDEFRDLHMDDLMTLKRAIALLDSALRFHREIDAKAHHFAQEVERLTKAD